MKGVSEEMKGVSEEMKGVMRRDAGGLLVEMRDAHRNASINSAGFICDSTALELAMARPMPRKSGKPRSEATDVS